MNQRQRLTRVLCCEWLLGNRLRVYKPLRQILTGPTRFSLKQMVLVYIFVLSRPEGIFKVRKRAAMCVSIKFTEINPEFIHARGSDLIIFYKDLYI